MHRIDPAYQTHTEHGLSELGGTFILEHACNSIG